MSYENIEDLTTQKAVRYYLIDSGYQGEQVDEAFVFATQECQNYNDWDEFGMLAVSYLLYGKQRVEEGERVAWEDGAIRRHLEQVAN